MNIRQIAEDTVNLLGMCEEHGAADRIEDAILEGVSLHNKRLGSLGKVPIYKLDTLIDLIYLELFEEDFVKEHKDEYYTAMERESIRKILAKWYGSILSENIRLRKKIKTLKEGHK